MIDSGSSICDQMYEINLAGNIIPNAWYQNLKRDTGKAYLLAINVLADICYWYRPTEIRDEETGCTIGYKKKFREDLLQKRYEELANQFGVSKRQITEAIVYLEKKGVVERIFRNIETKKGVLNNVLYLKLNPEKVKEITFISSPEKKGEVSLKNNISLHKKRGTNTKNMSQNTSEYRRGMKFNDFTLKQKYDIDEIENEFCVN